MSASSARPRARGGSPDLMKAGPCNPDRFTDRVMADEGAERAYCRCCGRRIRYVMGDDGTPDGYCRWCERGHPPRPKVMQGRLLSE